MKKLTRKQKVQEEEYDFPYHYIDLRSDEDHYINFIEYLNRLILVRRSLGQIKGKTILDAGCGDGRLCYELKNEGAKIVGIDYSPRALAFARAFNPGVKFVLGDIRDLKLPYKFNFVILMETLEHIPPKNIPSLLKGIHKIMSPHGKLIITVPSTSVEVAEKHYQHFTEDSLVKTLSPYFKKNEIRGYSRLGIKRKVFLVLIRMGLLMFPFRSRIPAVYRFYEWINKYFVNNLLSGSPEKCYGLIAVFDKNKEI